MKSKNAFLLKHADGVAVKKTRGMVWPDKTELVAKCGREDSHMTKKDAEKP